MHDAFSHTTGFTYRRRLRRESSSFSPSYGVRKGFIADVERPLPPDQKNLRRSPRLRASFDVLLDGERRRVAGDVSAEGAMFLLPHPSASNEVELFLQPPGEAWEIRATGRIIDRQPRATRVAHRVRFSVHTDRGQVRRYLELLARELSN